jgi:hypothetical protein
MYKRTQRLGADKTYKKPDVTFQEQLSKEEIAEKISGYQKVDNIMDVPINTHVRYFIFDKDGNASFRTGGLLQNKNNGDVYVVLSNGTFTWSVQVNNAQFYRKLTHAEELALVHDAYQNKIVDLKLQLKDVETKQNKVNTDIPIKTVAKTETATKTQVPIKKTVKTTTKTDVSVKKTGATKTEAPGKTASKILPPMDVELIETVRKPKKKIEKKTS